MKKVDLYCESASDYSISMISSDRVIKTITADKARELWKAGRVKDCNLAFKRLAEQFDFNVDTLRAYFKREPYQDQNGIWHNLDLGAAPVITPTKRGFNITRTPCVVCGEPPFGSEYACGHKQG